MSKNKKYLLGIILIVLLLIIGVLTIKLYSLDTPTSAASASVPPSSSSVGSTTVNSSGLIPPADTWEYSEYKDEMRGTLHKTATRTSTNAVNFTSPYEGNQHGTITVVDTNVFFSIEKGQIKCGENCNVLAKFDDDEAINFFAHDNGDNSTTITLGSGFLDKLKKSKKLQLEINVYQNGFPVFTFDVSGFKQFPAPSKSTDSNESTNINKDTDTASYIVQVYAFSNADTAKQEVEKLNRLGFKANTKKVSGTYRVWVGPYVDHNKADEMRQLMENKGLHPVVTTAY